MEKDRGKWIGKKEGHMDWKEGREEKEGEGLERRKGIGIGKNEEKKDWREGQERDWRKGRKYVLEGRKGLGIREKRKYFPERKKGIIRLEYRKEIWIGERREGKEKGLEIRKGKGIGKHEKKKD